MGKIRMRKGSMLRRRWLLGRMRGSGRRIVKGMRSFRRLVQVRSMSTRILRILCLRRRTFPNLVSSIMMENSISSPLSRSNSLMSFCLTTIKTTKSKD
jgi:hypothetical protein